MTNFILNDSFVAKDCFSKTECPEQASKGVQVGMTEDCFSKRECPREKYIKPTCEVVEIGPMQMLSVSGEGSDTGGDHEFDREEREPGFVNERNRGEWGDLWK